VETAIIVNHIILIPVVIVILWPSFARLDTRLHLPSQVRLSRPQEDQDCPREVSSPTGLGHFLSLHHLGIAPGSASYASSQMGYLFKPWVLPPRPFPRMLA
jgi:hypothetical protein